MPSSTLPAASLIAVGKAILASIVLLIRNAVSELQTFANGLGTPNSAFAAGHGGDGTDSALNATVNQSIDVGPAGKQYSSITIAAGVTVTFNPTGDAKVANVGCSGDLTMATGSTISLVGKGFAGGTGDTGSGDDGTSNPFSIGGAAGGGGGGGSSFAGGDGGGPLGQSPGNGGSTGSDATAAGADASAHSPLIHDPSLVSAGCGGGAGGGGGGTGGSGTAGGGGLNLEVAGDIDAAGGTIDTSSADASNSVQGAGGGGSGGDQRVVGRTITNAPTQVADGGAGGTSTGGYGDGTAGGAGRIGLVALG